MGKEALGEFELMVLLAVMHLGDDDAYSLAIADHIGARTGRSVRRSAVHTTLKRLEAKELIATWLGDPRPERGGKARRHVRLTSAGLTAVHDTRTALERMWRDVDTAAEST